MTLFGFRSLERAEVARVRTTQTREIAQNQADEQTIVQAWASAILDGDTEGARAIQTNAQEHGLIIMPEQLRAALIKANIEQTKLGAMRAPPELKANQLRALPDFLMQR